jgi:hypothetical protein
MAIASSITLSRNLHHVTVFHLRRSKRNVARKFPHVLYRIHTVANRKHDGQREISLSFDLENVTMRAKAATGVGPFPV